MAVRLYNNQEIAKIVKSGKIAYDTHMELAKFIKPGISTYKLNEIANNFIEKQNAKAAFLGFMGFPGHICTSLNDIVVHGIPRREDVLKDGDLIGIDIGIEYDGFYSDTAWTWPVGEISEENKKLVKVTQNCLFKGIRQAIVGNRIGAIGNAVQEHAESNGYSVVRSLVGHGVGKSIHEEPQVPNFGNRKDGTQIKVGMVLAIEPMINIGDYHVFTDKDAWSVKTKDGLASAHFEHTIAITSKGPVICTLPEGQGSMESVFNIVNGSK